MGKRVCVFGPWFSSMRKELQTSRTPLSLAGNLLFHKPRLTGTSRVLLAVFIGTESAVKHKLDLLKVKLAPSSEPNFTGCLLLKKTKKWGKRSNGERGGKGIKCEAGVLLCPGQRQWRDNGLDTADIRVVDEGAGVGSDPGNP